MDSPLCVCSVHTVILVGSARSLSSLHQVMDAHRSPSSTGLFALSSYGTNMWLSEGTRVSADYKGDNPCRVRIEISPSQANPRVVAALLAQLDDVYVQQCHIALDYVGYYIQLFEFQCSRLGLMRHILARNPHPHSYAWGAGDSHRRIAVYDKIEKCRAARVHTYRIVDVNGVVYDLPVSRFIADGISWFRIEVRLKGNWISGGSVPGLGALDDFIAKERAESALGLDLRTEATLDFIGRNPEAIRRLGRNSRTKYRKLMRLEQVEYGLTPDPREVYRDNYVAICDALSELCALGHDGSLNPTESSECISDSPHEDISAQSLESPDVDGGRS
jgi:hypothetical protein